MDVYLICLLGTIGGVVLVHRIRGEGGKMENDVNIGQEVISENASLVKLYIGVQILRSAKVAIIDHDDIIVLS